MKLFAVSIVCIIFSFSCNAPAEWLMFGGDSANSASSDTFVPRDLAAANIVSSGPIGIKDSSSPVVADGRVYVYCASSTNGAIRCLDSQSLATIWSAPVPVADYGWGSWASPALGSSSIVYAADAFLGCWNLDGSLRWSVTMEHQTVNSSPLIIENRIYIGAFSYMNAEGGVGCYDSATGSQLWFNAVINNSTFSSCSPVSLDDSITFGTGYACCSNQLWQFSLETGTTFWQRTLPGRGLNNISFALPFTLLVVNYDFMYAATNLYAYDTSGNFIWSAETGMSDMPPALYLDQSGFQIGIHSAGDSGVTPELSAFNLATGAELWRSSLAGNNANMPVISRDVVYAAQGRYAGWNFEGMTNLTAFDVRSGTPLAASGPVPGGFAPALSDDILYTADNGILYAYQWPVSPLSLKKFNGRVLLAKIQADACKFFATVPSAVIPTNWMNGMLEISISVGGIELFQKTDDEYVVAEKGDKKLGFKYISRDKSAKVKMIWKAKTGEVTIKALIKKHNLQSMLQQIPAQAGTTSQDLSILLQAENHQFDAAATVSVPITRKKDKLSISYKQ